VCENDMLLLDTGDYYCTKYHSYYCSRKLSASVCTPRADEQYVRPPNVTLNNIDVGNNAVALTGTGLSIAFGVSLRSVIQSHHFSLRFVHLDVKLID
jgi:hypothetical protein